MYLALFVLVFPTLHQIPQGHNRFTRFGSQKQIFALLFDLQNKRTKQALTATVQGLERSTLTSQTKKKSIREFFKWTLHPSPEFFVR